jgi:hypothetical protein
MSSLSCSSVIVPRTANASGILTFPLKFQSMLTLCSGLSLQVSRRRHQIDARIGEISKKRLIGTGFWPLAGTRRAPGKRR